MRYGPPVTVRSSPTPNVHRGERRYHVKSLETHDLHHLRTLVPIMLALFLQQYPHVSFIQPLSGEHIVQMWILQKVVAVHISVH